MQQFEPHFLGGIFYGLAKMGLIFFPLKLLRSRLY